jgi:hypothetical protein
LRLRRSLIVVGVVFFADFVGKKHHADNCFWGLCPSMGFTYWEREGTGFPRNPMIVGYVVFSTKSKNQHTPLQSRGTLLRAFCAVRKQHTKQVTPVEGLQPPIPRFAKRQAA